MTAGGTLRRRTALAGVAAACVAPGAGAGTARPLRIIVPLGPGGAADAQARLIGESVARRLGRPLVVDHRPNGVTVAGMLALASAAPDGDTIGFVVSSLAIQAAFGSRVPYRAVEDFAPICLCGHALIALVALPELAADDPRELLRLAASSRPPLQCASLGVGSASHLALELFNALGGVGIEHIPYNGSTPVYQALLGRHIALAYVTLESALPHVRSGRLKVLGITAAARSPAFPEYAPIAETVPGAEVNGFFGFMAPARTPAATIERLYAEFAAALRSSAVSERLRSLAAFVTLGSPAEFAAFLREEIARYAELARRTGIRLG